MTSVQQSGRVYLSARRPMKPEQVKVDRAVQEFIAAHRTGKFSAHRIAEETGHDSSRVITSIRRLERLTAVRRTGTEKRVGRGRSSVVFESTGMLTDA